MENTLYLILLKTLFKINIFEKRTLFYWWSNKTYREHIIILYIDTNTLYLLTTFD